MYLTKVRPNGSSSILYSITQNYTLLLDNRPPGKATRMYNLTFLDAVNWMMLDSRNTAFTGIRDPISELSTLAPV